VHVDIVGPLPVATEGYAYLLTAVDRSTRWVEAYPLKFVVADCAAVFVAEVVARFGVSAILTSDRGVQFTSTMWAAVMSGMARAPTLGAPGPESRAAGGFRAVLCGAGIRQFLSAAEPPPEAFVWQLSSGVPCVAPLPPPQQAASSPPPSLMAVEFVYMRSPPASLALAPAYRGRMLSTRRGTKSSF
jgi:Integrase core domain